MLTIRAQQFSSLAGPGDQRFAQRLLPVIRELWPRQTYGLADDELLEWIESSIADARLGGFEDRRNQAHYASFAVLFGGDFPGGDDFAWARDIMAQRNLKEDDRMGALYAYAQSYLRTGA